MWVFQRVWVLGLGLVFSSSLFSTNAFAEFFEVDIDLGRAGYLLLPKNEAETLEMKVDGFEVVKRKKRDDTQLHFITQELLRRAKRHCERFACHDNENEEDDAIACRNVAAIPMEDAATTPYNPADNTALYKMKWEERKGSYYLTGLTCTSEPPLVDYDEFAWVDGGDEKASSSSSSGGWFSWLPWGGKKTVTLPESELVANTPSKPATEDKTEPVLESKPEPEKEETSLAASPPPATWGSTFWRWGGAVARTAAPAAQSFIEGKRHQNLLHPDTWSLYGNLYDFMAIWATHAGMAAAAAITEAATATEGQAPKVYLDEIIDNVRKIVENKNKDLTDAQVAQWNVYYLEAREALFYFKKRRSEPMKKAMAATAATAATVELPTMGATAGKTADTVSSSSSSHQPSPPPPPRPQAETRQSDQPHLTLESAMESMHNAKLANQPTLDDLQYDDNLKKKFNLLRQILEYPVIKWPIDKVEMMKRVRDENAPRRGAKKYQDHLRTIAIGIAEDSHNAESRRKLRYFYGETGNGKTSGITEMFVNWLQLPLCMIKANEVIARDKEAHKTVTKYVEFRIQECLKTIFIEPRSGQKIRNGILLLDDLDGLFVEGGELADEKSEDRYNLMLLFKKLGDPTDKTIEVPIKIEREYNLPTSIQKFEVKSTDIYTFITANSLIREFKPASETGPKPATISAMLDRAEVYELPNPDQPQRLIILLNEWAAVETVLNKELHDEYYSKHQGDPEYEVAIKVDGKEEIVPKKIDSSICKAALEALVERDWQEVKKTVGLQMGVRGLIDLFRAYSATIQGRQKHPEMCHIIGSASRGDAPFDLEGLAKNIGPYQKGQTGGLIEAAFKKKVEEFEAGNQDKIDKIATQAIRLAVLIDLGLAKDPNAPLEARQEALRRVERMIVPSLSSDFDQNSMKRPEEIVGEIGSRLRHLNDTNQELTIALADQVLRNFKFQDITNPVYVVEQDGVSDLGILSNLAKIIGIPYCRVTQENHLVSNKEIEWEQYVKSKVNTNVFVNVSSRDYAAKWDEPRKVYYTQIGNNKYIADSPSGGNSYYGVAISDSEWNRTSKSESKWLDLCEDSLVGNKADLPYALVHIDRSHLGGNGVNQELINNMSNVINGGMTKRPSGPLLNVKGVTVVISVNASANAAHKAWLTKQEEEGKVRTLTLAALLGINRIRYAELCFEEALQDAAQKVDRKSGAPLASGPKINFLLAYMVYLDQTACYQKEYWDQHNADVPKVTAPSSQQGVTGSEPSNQSTVETPPEPTKAAIEPEPLRSIIQILKHEIIRDVTSQLGSKSAFAPKQHLLDPWVKRWKSTYQQFVKMDLEILPLEYDGVPQIAWGQPLEELEESIGQRVEFEKIGFITRKDEERRIAAEKERIRLEEEHRKAEEERRRKEEEERLEKLRLEEEQRKAAAAEKAKAEEEAREQAALVRAQELLEKQQKAKELAAKKKQEEEFEESRRNLQNRFGSNSYMVSGGSSKAVSPGPSVFW